MEFVLDQYDDLIAFKVSASKGLEGIRARLDNDKIPETYDHIQKPLDTFELYSYQFNIKIVGMPMVAEREHPEQTANLCLELFSALGVKGVLIQDIYTAHQVASMKPSDWPNAIGPDPLFHPSFVHNPLKDEVLRYANWALSWNAKRTYTSGEKHFILARTVWHCTIKIKLAAVRNLHIVSGYNDPLQGKLLLKKILRGILHY